MCVILRWFRDTLGCYEAALIVWLHTHFDGEEVRMLPSRTLLKKGHILCSPLRSAGINLAEIPV
jgi:hypothetical protein